MVDDGCHNGLIKYCKTKGISYKEYPKKPVNPTVNTLTVNRRKKIPPKSNDSVVSDHETSTSCSEGEDDAGYIKSIKATFHAINPKKSSTGFTPTSTTTTAFGTTVQITTESANKVNIPEAN